MDALTSGGAPPEIGRTYDVVIGEVLDTEWTGPLGIATIGGVRVVVPKAGQGERLSVRVTGVVLDPWTGRPEARFELVTGGPDEALRPIERPRR
jgi:hypothetical protein